MRPLPDDVTVYKETAVFTEKTLPEGLLREHRTKADVWGCIRVLEGALLYRILEPAVSEHRLDPETPGIVEPGMAHEVEVVGPVRFKVEFLRAGDP